MATHYITFDEVRFDLRNDTQTIMWVLVSGSPVEIPHQMLGWHYKAFPVSEYRSVMEIVLGWNDNTRKPEWDVTRWPTGVPLPRHEPR